MKRWLLVFFAASQIGAETPTYSSRGLEAVPLVAVVANPGDYAGKRIRVEGFLILEFEGNSLYLDKEGYKAGLTGNALWVDTPSWADPAAQKRLSGRYALVEGTFNPLRHGHVGAWGGALENVSLIRPTSTRSDYQQWKIQNSDTVLLQAMPRGLAVFFSLLIAFSLIARLRIRRRPRP